MKLTRLDLDGAGSPSAIVTRILQLEPALSLPVPIEELCRQLDIASIDELETDGFEAALIADECKSSGAILVAKDRSRQRRRFSIAHELGHFLIPAHRPVGPTSYCSATDLTLVDPKEQDRRRRMEMEANKFAALLLMPPPMLRAELQKIRSPDVADIVRLAKLFDVSKDAIARAYVDFSRETVAVVVIRSGRVLRIYRNVRHFPWVAISPGEPVPSESSYHNAAHSPGARSPTEECDPWLWLGESAARNVSSLTEQVLGQESGYALLMLQAELLDEDIE